MESLNTLQEAIIHFAARDNCHALMVQLRWPDGKVKCPRCGAERVIFLPKTRVWKCYVGHEKPTFSLKTGTIFEESPLGLEKWLPALWLVVNCKNGISSCELARDLGVTQKTAWFMAHRLRYALKEGGVDLFSAKLKRMKPSPAERHAICTLRSASTASLARTKKRRLPSTTGKT